MVLPRKRVICLVKYSLVLLDADGTLFDYDQAESLALKRAFDRHGFTYSENILSKYREINMHLWAEFERGRVDKDALQADRFRILFQEIGVSTAPSAFNELYLDYLAEGSFLLKGALDLCRELSLCSTLAMATNGTSRTQKKRLENSQLAPFIRHIIVSEEAGYQKPQRGFFDYALRCCGHTERSSVIILGDSLHSDIKGGSDFGITTCWYNPRGEKPAEGDKNTARF